MNKYAFVLPRFGKGIAGGAETLMGSLATKLAERGDKVEILTTCAKDNRTWANELPEGVSNEENVLVRRFAVNPRDLERWLPLQIRLSEGLQLTLDEQLTWMAESVISDELFKYIAAEASNFDALFFGPYLFGSTFWGSLIAPKRSILIPCLHDEVYAYQDVVASMFREVKGALFNSHPEMELAFDLYGEVLGAEVGMGFEPHSQNYIDSLKPYFSDSFPYLVYVGRKETGKNAQLLIDYFIKLKELERALDLKLVIMGGGDFSDLNREHVRTREDIIDLQHLPEKDKHRVIHHALALCQPSVNESFSIVLMEAWLLNVPVLVHGLCNVTRQHVIDSGGGLYFSNESDFIEVVSELLQNRPLREQLGASGSRYVSERYNWKAVLKRFDSAIKLINEQQDKRKDSRANARS